MPDEDSLTVNEGKKPIVEADGRRYACLAVRTRVITAQDELGRVLAEYAGPFVREGDTVFLSEKMVACTQGRAIPVETIRPGRLARLLSRFVTRSEYGIGLSMPETMQCAIRECGTARILLAALAGALGRALGRRGWFYRVAGERAAGIDGPCACTLPPYNRHVVLTPLAPDRTAEAAAAALGGRVGVAIVDLNDLGGRVLGVSPGAPDGETLLRLLRQNPLGQGHQSTPIGILRPVA